MVVCDRYFEVLFLAMLFTPYKEMFAVPPVQEENTHADKSCVHRGFYHCSPSLIR